MIKIKPDDDYLEAYDGDIKVGSLCLFTDDNDLQWLDGIEVKKEYRRKGVATKLIKAAIKKSGCLYISTASKIEQEYNGDDTARYLTIEGAALVNKLIEKRVIKDEWMINPFE